MDLGASVTTAERFGSNLVNCRRRAGLSQERLAARAGLHRVEIGLLERSRRGGRIDTLMKLAGALEVEPSELLAGIAWQPVENPADCFHDSHWLP